MPDYEKKSANAYSMFDYMRTDELKAILKKDAEQPEDATDEEKILAILAVLEKREAEKNPQPADLDAAWDVFQREYLPLAEKGIALYEEELDEPELHEAKTVPFPQKKRKKRLPKALRVAAAVIIIAFVGSLTAEAAGIPVWNTVVTWTQEAFGFGVAERHAEWHEELVVEIPEQCQELNDKLKQHGTVVGVIPSYIPEGYQVIRLESAELTDEITYVLLLSDGEHNIVLSYCLYFGEFGVSEYQKNDGAPEPYEAGGITHYIAQNVDTFVAIWRNDNLECSISGVSTREELIEMIDSIYEVKK